MQAVPIALQSRSLVAGERTADQLVAIAAQRRKEFNLCE
jgi:hypothetical protein